VLVIRQRDARHLAVETGDRGAGRGRADGAQEARRSQSPKQARVDRVLGQVAVRSAVAERQDRFAAKPIARVGQRTGDPAQRLVPADVAVRARPLPPVAHGRTEDALGPVHVLGKAAHLCADEARGQGVIVRAVHADDTPAFDLHLQAAGVRTVEGADRTERLGSHRPRRIERLGSFGTFNESVTARRAPRV
jgi:hypothetical protein